MKIEIARKAAHQRLIEIEEAHGNGICTLLARHAISVPGATGVDVDEQNKAATGIYKLPDSVVLDPL